MQTFTFNKEWLDEIMPQGMVIPSSTLISGEGGSGKPLIGFSIMGSWLEQGGTIIFILTNTGLEFAKYTFKDIYGIDIAEYKDQLRFIELNPDMGLNAAPTGFKSWDTTAKANLVNPENWDQALNMAEKELPAKEGPGMMVYGSALNLILFSKTYGDLALQKFEDYIRNDKTKTWLFAVSTSALANKIEVLEKAADNLMFTRGEKPMKLFLTISRMKKVVFEKSETKVPLSKEELETIKKLAEKSRSSLIPKIKRI